MTDITTIQGVASAVLNAIPDDSRWSKRTYDTDSGRRHCVLGVVLRLHLYAALARDFYARLGEIIDSEYPERVGGIHPCSRGKEGHVVLFNDHPDTSYSDVRRVLEKVAAG